MSGLRWAALTPCIFFVLLSTHGFAQNPSTYYEETPQTFYGGLVAGTSFTQVDGDAYAGYHKVGFNAGAIVYARLADKLAGSLEILFSQKGSRGHYVQEIRALGEFLTDYKINLNYVEVPVMLNYFDRRRSHFGAGLSYSQLITSEEFIKTDKRVVDPTPYPFRKADLNIVLSGNLHLWKGLFLNARFQYSAIPIRTNHPPGFGRSEQFNNVWVTRLMYLF